MIICVCHNLNDRVINSALSNNIPANKVHEHLSCKVNCGRCLQTIRLMEKEHENNITVC